MALSWCKVASNLDSHPKIRKAGRNGREVFLFALRRNAEPGNPIPGRLPTDELEPWYLADQLQMPETDAVTGVTAAVTAGLLVLDGNSYLIVGWEQGWGKDNGTGAERTARYRENKKLQTSVTGVTSPNVTSSLGDTGDTEEKRLEEKRLDQKREKASPSLRARRKGNATSIPSDWTPTPEHAALAVKRGVDLSLQADRFRAHADANDRRAVRWNAAFTQWLLGSNPDRSAISRQGSLAVGRAEPKRPEDYAADKGATL